jgi:hypothetical protein
MKAFTLRVTEAELTALRSYAAAKRMSIAAVILTALDNHLPNFPKKAATRNVVQVTADDLSDLDFDTE